MSSDGKVRVVVRSRKVPIGFVFHTEPVYSASGVLLGTRPKRLVLFGNTLDEEHRRAIDEGEKLSRNLGLHLEVVDAARKGILGRVLSSFGLAGPSRPIVVISPPPASESNERIPESLSAVC